MNLRNIFVWFYFCFQRCHSYIGHVPWLMPVYFEDFYKSEEAFLNLKNAHSSILVSSKFLTLFHLHLKKRKKNVAHCTTDFIRFQMETPQHISSEVSDCEPCWWRATGGLRIHIWLHTIVCCQLSILFVNFTWSSCVST